MRIIARIFIAIMACTLSYIIISGWVRREKKDKKFIKYNGNAHVKQNKIKRPQCADGIVELIQSFDIPQINHKVISEHYQPDTMTLIQVINGTIYSSPPSHNEMVFERDRRTAFLWMLNHALPGLPSNKDFELLLSVKDCCDQSQAPIFSVTRCSDTNQLPYVQWNQIRDGPLDSWNLRMRRGRGRMKKCLWDQRLPTAIFRGSLSKKFSFNELGQPQTTTVNRANWRRVGRSILAHLANETKREQLFDVKLRYVKKIIDDYPFEEASEEISMEQQACKYKYTAIVEGNCGWADRFKSFLSMGTLCLVQETLCKEYYGLLATPNHHYIPIAGSLNNLTEAVRWARSHDVEVKQIIENGIKFFDKYLTKSSMLCYMQELLSAYQTKYEGSVVVSGGRRPVD